MTQLPIDFTAERAAREEGKRRALERADRDSPGWGELAFAYLRLYASRNAGLFTGEQVTQASKVYGLIQPANLRAWGAIYTRAQREGVIEVVDNNGRRANGNATPRYRSLIRRAA